ncbi:hypothetical protein EIN_397590 [Entamoeba invadens IP1]|uniref:Dilute domain-containing protein n=1 Tax=Entamoeba invadens IP1 TaxID=370355 RepID=A0A0A1UFR3_ENTIV|nr:hypothetical protein EIN_397590 [Entamoeba invadens IP1]ELP91859.1 hypothetical protein EIN_397590 [Entamoeba invadens IP1]|eukprot:XP_004258630.1 hypothetical protein EIN_397590 [Entamoeba invadens IP1]
MSHKKVEVKVQIHKVFSSAPEVTLEQVGYLTCSVTRGSVNETTNPFQVNKAIEQSFHFVSTFILKSRKEQTYKDKELVFQIKLPLKKKEIMKTTINLSKIINIPPIQQNYSFQYKSIPMQLFYTISFKEKVEVIKFSPDEKIYDTISLPKKPSSTLPETASTSSCAKTSRSASKVTTASSQISSDIARSAQNERGANGSRADSYASMEQRRIVRTAHQRVRSAIGKEAVNNVEMFVSPQQATVDPKIDKFINDISQVSSLMQFDLDAQSTPLTNPMMTEVMFYVLLKFKAFEGNEEVLMRTTTAMNEVSKSEMLYIKQATYLFSSLTRLAVLVLKTGEKMKNSTMAKYIKVLIEPVSTTYQRILTITRIGVKSVIENVFERKLVKCDELVSFIEESRKTFESMRVLNGLSEVFAKDLVSLINAYFVDEVVNPQKGNCTFEIGMNATMVFSYLNDYFRKKHIFNIKEKSPFEPISEISRVLLLGDKSVLADAEARKNICPNMSLAKIIAILENLSVEVPGIQTQTRQSIQKITEAEYDDDVKNNKMDITFEVLQKIALQTDESTFVKYKLEGTPIAGRNYYS